MADQRRARRWGGVWRFLIAAYIGIFLGLALVPTVEVLFARTKAHAGLVQIDGVIARDGGTDVELVRKALASAYKSPRLDAVILEINSPGGSPVQAERITNEIRRWKAKRPEIPVIAIIGEVGASAAYFVAAAADAIVAAQSSLVGSIGVRIDSFGLTGLMEALGIERRLFTAGEHKGALDMFSPVTEPVASHVQTMLAELHAQFIEAVRDGRGERLADDETLFSGLFWSGERALALGLVDRLGDRATELQALDLETAVDYTPSDLMQAISKGVGAAMSGVLSAWDGGVSGRLAGF
ncbi:S49 family peptidase [Thiohalocapsa sp.]|uniref:S49 family peptidase n=1 Tax=Thiohalocapsa sp. TaxID=2497641 RepID=UPI0025FCD4EA|nr:S49 family peptidase [Thiohalocapsa sp.]